MKVFTAETFYFPVDDLLLISLTGALESNLRTFDNNDREKTDNDGLAGRLQLICKLPASHLQIVCESPLGRLQVTFRSSASRLHSRRCTHTHTHSYTQT